MVNIVRLLVAGGLVAGGAILYNNKLPIDSYLPKTQIHLDQLPSSEETKVDKKPRRPRKPKQSSYKEAVELAKANSMHLLVWVNYKNSDLEKQLANCVHFHTKTFEQVAVPSALIIGKNVQGTFFRFDLLDTNNLSIDQIKIILNN